VSTGIASAQSTAGDAEEFRRIASKITTESKVFPLVRDPSNLSKQTSPEPSISFLASNDGAVAKARFGYLVQDIVSLDALITAPVRGEAATFLDKSGLGKGVSLEGDLTLVLSRKTTGEPTTEIARRARPMSGAAASPAMVPGHGGDLTLDDLVAMSLRVAGSDSGSGALPSSRGVERTTALNEGLQSARTEETSVLATQLNNRRGREAFATAFRFLANDRNLWHVDRALLLTLTGSAGRPSFVLADTATAAFRGVTKDVHSGGAALGLVINRNREAVSQGFYVGGSVQWATTVSGTARNTCLPTGSAGALTCQNALQTEPNPDSTRIIQGDVRFYFSNLSIAVAAQPSHDRTAKETTFAFPIYFLANSKDLQSALTPEKGGGLTGGVNVGWRRTPNAHADFFAVFFVGSLFKLPGVPH
jgi:hypothetical protein